MSDTPDKAQPTEAVAFDPFADDEEPGTEAVAFDPFADDGDDAEGWDSDGETDYSAMGEMAGLLQDLDKLRKGGKREDTSQRSREAPQIKALSPHHGSQEKDECGRPRCL